LTASFWHPCPSHHGSDLAVANTLEAVERGFTLVAGSIEGLGTHARNANLCSVIADLENLLGHTVVGPDYLRKMAATSQFNAKTAVRPIRRQEDNPAQSLFQDLDQRLLAGLMEPARGTEPDTSSFWGLTHENCWPPAALWSLVREAIRPNSGRSRRSGTKRPATPLGWVNRGARPRCDGACE